MMNNKTVCGAIVLVLAVTVFVVSIVLGYVISTEFMVFAFPLFITTLMCGIKCMEPCTTSPEDDEPLRTPLVQNHHHGYGTTHPNSSSSSASSSSSDNDDDDDNDDNTTNNNNNTAVTNDPENPSASTTPKPDTTTTTTTKSHSKVSSGSTALKDWLDGTATPADPEDPDNDFKSCIICLDRPREMVFRKCGHMCLCHKCCKHITRCPICQRKGRAVKVHLV